MDYKKIKLTKHEKIYTVVVLIIAIVIITAVVFPNQLKSLIYGEDYDEISYGITVNPESANIIYSIKFPIPTNWTMIDFLITSEGNVSYMQTIENRSVMLQSGIIKKQLDYINVTGQGPVKLTFKYRSSQISNIYFDGLNWPNSTVDMYVETTPINSPVNYMFGFAYNHISPTHTTPSTGWKLWSNGTISKNGWRQVDTESIGW